MEIKQRKRNDNRNKLESPSKPNKQIEMTTGISWNQHGNQTKKEK